MLDKVDLTSASGVRKLLKKIQWAWKLHGQGIVTVGEPGPSGRILNLQRSRPTGTLAKLTGGSNPYDYVLLHPDYSEISGSGGSNAYELNGLTDLCADGATPKVLMRSVLNATERRFQFNRYGRLGDPPPPKIWVCITCWGCNSKTKKIHVSVKRHDTGEEVAASDECNADKPLCLFLIHGVPYDITASHDDYITRTISFTPDFQTSYPIKILIQLITASDSVGLKERATKTCACACPDPKLRTLQMSGYYGSRTIEYTNLATVCCPNDNINQHWTTCFKIFDSRANKVEWVPGTGAFAGSCQPRCSYIGADIAVRYCLECNSTNWTMSKCVPVFICPGVYNQPSFGTLAGGIFSPNSPPSCIGGIGPNCETFSTGWYIQAVSDPVPVKCKDPINLTFTIPDVKFFGATIPTGETVTVTE